MVALVPVGNGGTGAYTWGIRRGMEGICLILEEFVGKCCNVSDSDRICCEGENEVAVMKPVVAR
jgi:hypothetical protein